jgi:hypothetical protein
VLLDHVASLGEGQFRRAKGIGAHSLIIRDPELADRNWQTADRARYRLVARVRGGLGAKPNYPAETC